MKKKLAMNIRIKNINNIQKRIKKTLQTTFEDNINRLYLSTGYNNEILDKRKIIFSSSIRPNFEQEGFSDRATADVDYTNSEGITEFKHYFHIEENKNYITFKELRFRSKHRKLTDEFHTLINEGKFNDDFFNNYKDTIILLKIDDSKNYDKTNYILMNFEEIHDIDINKDLDQITVEEFKNLLIKFTKFENIKDEIKTIISEVSNDYKDNFSIAVALEEGFSKLVESLNDWENNFTGDNGLLKKMFSYEFKTELEGLLGSIIKEDTPINLEDLFDKVKTATNYYGTLQESFQNKIDNPISIEELITLNDELKNNNLLNYEEDEETNEIKVLNKIKTLINDLKPETAQEELTVYKDTLPRLNNPNLLVQLDRKENAFKNYTLIQEKLKEINTIEQKITFITDIKEKNPDILNVTINNTTLGNIITENIASLSLLDSILVNLKNMLDFEKAEDLEKNAEQALEYINYLNDIIKIPEYNNIISIKFEEIFDEQCTTKMLEFFNETCKIFSLDTNNLKVFQKDFKLNKFSKSNDDSQDNTLISTINYLYRIYVEFMQLLHTKYLFEFTEDYDDPCFLYLVYNEKKTIEAYDQSDNTDEIHEHYNSENSSMSIVNPTNENRQPSNVESEIVNPTNENRQPSNVESDVDVLSDISNESKK